MSSLRIPQVFIRELISNGSDALEKLRHKLITGGGDTAPMEVHLQTDPVKGTFTIQVSNPVHSPPTTANFSQVKRSPGFFPVHVLVV